MDLPIKHLFWNVEKGIDLEAASKVPFDDPQLLTIAYNLLWKTGNYQEEYKDGTITMETQIKHGLNSRVF